MPTIAIASDHGGLELKELLIEELKKQGKKVINLGTNTNESVDYPDYANIMADAIKDGQADKGILICGTGIGISIAANRHPEIRAALVHDAFTTRMCREHNDANVLALGGRTTGIEIAKDCVRIFLETEFEGGRHAKRIGKMSSPSKGCCC
ncbi:MAG: ribose 5-phosphate isomerase B [Alphaproteobacteria bacterium]|nr:ribose 5-phosphate isomerase B [Alphaproteobacteria bacterium]